MTSKLLALQSLVCQTLQRYSRQCRSIPMFRSTGFESKQFEYIVAEASGGQYSKGNSCLLDVESKRFGSIEVKSQNRTAKTSATHLRTTLCRDYELGEFVQSRGPEMLYSRDIFRKMVSRLNRKSAGTLVTIVQYKDMKYDVYVTAFPRFSTQFREWTAEHTVNSKVWTFRHWSGIELQFNLKGYKVEGRIPLSEPQRVSA